MLHLPPDGRIRALTVREPWATLCCMESANGSGLPIKNCEIRTWQWYHNAYPLPLTLAIHASADYATTGNDLKKTVAKHDDAYFAFDNQDCVPCVPGKDYFYASVIVGLVDVVGCMLIDPTWNKKEKTKRIADAGFENAELYANWAQPPYSFLLANPRRFKQGIYCPGKQSIWTVTPEVQAEIERKQNELLVRRCDIYEESPQCELMPDKPSGIVKCLGKPNYAALNRQAQERLTQS